MFIRQSPAQAGFFVALTVASGIYLDPKRAIDEAPLLQLIDALPGGLIAGRRGASTWT